MSDYLIELAEAMARHMPNKDIDYWMDLILHDPDIEKQAVKFRKEDMNKYLIPHIAMEVE